MRPSLWTWGHPVTSAYNQGIFNILCSGTLRAKELSL